jgi:hypothetical protein
MDRLHQQKMRGGTSLSLSIVSPSGSRVAYTFHDAGVELMGPFVFVIYIFIYCIGKCFIDF